ncbi:protein kinase, putative [Trypanosoma brucei gambiense DAL972]|uniref:non-specific serine/threonine protein kinase n=2 Tax=Trypanosoma brucei TaxID=5691 RepID=C9ZXD7_TRYB9|nr:protein kinase, putative [Trypanosoma brucei gambiense DAL972]RHW70265.1 protein kinase [Trypanosoma brucei equiperdum]CBH14081.1 protein kinase, putative [Trypanosoma brucei gambiense DAL972]|eukprot:XP_011776352.1 protein kinase, putative [Trypanosoma brucei gambiense DAL972]
MGPTCDRIAKMLPHPILASDDDRQYVQESILSLPDMVENFFTSLERVYTDGKCEEAKQAFATYHSIQTIVSVLCRVPASAYRTNDEKRSIDWEIYERIKRMGHLFLGDIVVVGPQSLNWRVPVMRLAEEVAQRMRCAYVEFPFMSVLLREAVSYSSVAFILVIAIFAASVVFTLVVLVTLPTLSPSTTVGLLVGLTAFLLVSVVSCGFLYLFVTSAKALKVLHTWILEERMYTVLLSSASSEGDLSTTGPSAGAAVPQVTRGHNTKNGYYTIPYGNALGYIEGKHVDAQVVMIGFDDKYRITRWNMAAEVVTGFLESGCVGKPLSDLVITPTGDIERDLAPLQVFSGEVLKLKLRAFATVPVTLFTVAVPILNQEGSLIGRILICANAKDNLGEYRTYIRDYVVSEVNLSLSEILEGKAVTPRGLSVIGPLQSFLEYGYGKQVEELARGMLAEWEWTSSEQLLGQMLRLSPLDHKTSVDSLFPGTLCLHPCIPEAVATLLNSLRVPCHLRLQILNSSRNTFALQIVATPVAQAAPSTAQISELREKLLPHLRSTCGSIREDDGTVVFRFPCQITAALEDIDDATFRPADALNERYVIDQTRAIVNCTVNVLTLITNLVDQHNISMILLRTMFVSLTSVRERCELEKRLQSSPSDIDVIVCDRGWLNSVQDLVHTLSYDIIVVPISEPGVRLALEGFQYVINTPISSTEVRKVLMAIGTAVSLRKNAATAQEERERILTLRQDSPWTKGVLLGRGSFGAVYEATSDLTGGKMAVKMFYFTEDLEESINALLNEIKIMCSLNHPNIVHYFHCERKENSVNLFMELCCCSLGDIIYGRSQKPPDLTVIKVLRQLLTALTYLHARGVAHRDVKPQNILIKGDVVKITDFGTARQGVGSEDVQGTLRYMAPEVYRGEDHCSPCDIWSVGCVAAELFDCPPLFMETPHMLADMTDVDYYVDGLTSNPVLCDFLRMCFCLQPEGRATAADLLLHRLFSSSCSAEVESLPDIFSREKQYVSSLTITTQPHS